MTRYLEIKPGSIAEVAIRLRDDYQAFFKKELEKAGKGIAQMTDAEKKAFFNRVDKAYNAKNEATSQDVSQSLATKPKSEPKTTMVVKPGAPKGQESVIRIPVEKLADYKKKGYIEAESYIPEQSTQPGGGKHYPQSILIKRKGEGLSAGKEIEKRIPARELSDYQKMGWSKVEEQSTVKSHIIKYTNKDTGAVSSKTITGSDREDILKKTDEWKKNNNVTVKSVNPVFKNEEKAVNPYAVGMAAAMKATGDKPPLKKSTITKAHDIAKSIEKKEEVKEEVIEEGQYKEIDTRKGDLRIAKDKKQALKDKYNAIMAGQASGDEHAVEAQIQKLDMSIKKQEQELIDIMKKSKDSEKKEAVDPMRVSNLATKVQKMTTKLNQLDKSAPAS